MSERMYVCVCVYGLSVGSANASVACVGREGSFMVCGWRSAGVEIPWWSVGQKIGRHGTSTLTYPRRAGAGRKPVQPGHGWAQGPRSSTRSGQWHARRRAIRRRRGASSLSSLSLLRETSKEIEMQSQFVPSQFDHGSRSRMPLHATLHSLSSDDDHHQFSQVSRRKCRRGRREFKKEAKETAAWSSGSCNAKSAVTCRSRHSRANLIRLSSGRERMGWDTTTVTRP